MRTQDFEIAVSVLLLSGACFDPSAPASQTNGAEATSTGESTGNSSPPDSGGSAASEPATSSDRSSTTGQSTTTDHGSTAEASTATDHDSTSGASTTTDHDSTTTGDDTDASTTGSGTEVTIYEIQQGEVPVDTIATVSGAVCTAVANNGFFMQDPAGGEWSGIWVFTGMGARLPAPGDVLTVTGTYEEFFGLSEINVAAGTITVTDSPGGGNVPEPEPIGLADIGESWESVFLQISDPSIRVAELHPMPAVHDFRVESSDGSTAWVDDRIYDAQAGDFADFGIDATFTMIQGPLDYSFDEFRLTPRSMADLSGYAPP